MKLSCCIITLNEEENLPRCLESARQVADEILVVDSGSSDRTETIARQFGARWEPRDWPGFVAQKNRALALARHPWVLSLDADEELSPELIREIRALKEKPETDAPSGYSMPRMVRFQGKWIRRGDWYPDRLVRLFRRDQARFAGGSVHERLELQGPVTPLRSDLYHYSFRDAADLRERTEKYARLWAQDRLAAGKTCQPWTPHLRAAFRFLRGYLLKRGFLDGPQGLTIAYENARAVHLKYSLLRTPEARRPRDRT